MDKKYLCIDIGGTFIKFGLVDSKGNIIKKWKEQTERNSLKKFMEITDVAVKSNIEKTGIGGIAISMPGRIEVKNGIAITGGSINFVHNTNIKKIFETRYGIKTSVANDGHCVARAELWKGSLMNCCNGVCIVFGTGIAGGIVIDNKVVEGSNFGAGEISCLITDYNQFDSNNFLGRECSTKALLRKYDNEYNPHSSGLELFERIRQGDGKACKIYKKFLVQISAAIYSIQALLDCKVIAIGGGISNVKYLISDIKKAVDMQYGVHANFPVEKPNIVPCKFKSESNLIGALAYFLEAD